MCSEHHWSADWTPSRFRWYDWPALLLAHRPMRCLVCGRRFLAICLGPIRFKIFTKATFFLAVVCLFLGTMFIPDWATLSGQIQDVLTTSTNR